MCSECGDPSPARTPLLVAQKHGASSVRACGCFKAEEGTNRCFYYFFFGGGLNKVFLFIHAHLGLVRLQKGYFQLGCENKSRCHGFYEIMMVLRKGKIRNAYTICRPCQQKAKGRRKEKSHGSSKNSEVFWTKQNVR